MIKCDQEPAIKALRSCITQELSGVAVIPEESSVGESRSNGEVERAVRTVKGQFRTFRNSI